MSEKVVFVRNYVSRFDIVVETHPKEKKQTWRWMWNALFPAHTTEVHFIFYLFELVCRLVCWTDKMCFCRM